MYAAQRASVRPCVSQKKKINKSVFNAFQHTTHTDLPLDLQPQKSHFRRQSELQFRSFSSRNRNILRTFRSGQFQSKAKIKILKKESRKYTALAQRRQSLLF